MEKEKIINFREKLERIVSEHNDIVEKESEGLIREYNIDSSKNIQKILESIENKERLLQIGIVGRVKAGKSSLLNALLFDGQVILPKAATPMTAALTILSYGKELSAEVEFFSKEDINNIKKNHDEYKKRNEKLTQEKLKELKKREKKIRIFDKAKKVTPSIKAKNKELEEKANKQAHIAMKEELELSAAYDQYNKIKQSNKKIETLGDKKILESKNIENLSKILSKHVSADGEYMPFTKSVRIELPQNNLKDIQIVDTPGLNDTVQSREERTRELLKYCDVVFIVSPSGQFLSNEDLELMDRITTKEGVRELFVVSSQVDTQLFGSEKNKFNGNLPKVLKGITSNLGGHLSSTLSRLKKSNPEVGTTFDQLITQGKEKVIHSSGICQTIKLLFDEKEKWDDGVQKVWGNLTREYPDYFSNNDKVLSQSNLNLLANIPEIKNIVTEVRAKKDEILNKRREEFVQAKLNSLKKYKKSLISYAKEQVSRIENSDIEEIKKQKSNLNKVLKKASLALKEEYDDLLDDFQIDIKKKLIGTLNSYFKKTWESVDDAEKSETEYYEVSNSSWYNPFSWGSSETRSRTYTTVRTGAVRNSLADLTLDIKNTISIQSQEITTQWRKNLYSQLVGTLRSNVNDDDLDPQLIRSTIRNVLNSIDYPDIEYDVELPDSLEAKGTLTGSSAEDFIESAKNYLSSLKRIVNGDIKAYLKSLIDTLEKIDPSSKIFGDYKEKIEQLEEQIKYKGITLGRFDNFAKKLVEIE